jgi:hypothetical protein
MARWSGASQLAFRTLNKVLAAQPELDGLYLYLADTDSDKTQELVSELGDVPAGAGETYWLVEGQVQHKLAGYKEEAFPILQRYTQHILSWNNNPGNTQRGHY